MSVRPTIAAGSDGRVVVAWAKQTDLQADGRVLGDLARLRSELRPARARPGRPGRRRPVRPVDRDRARRSCRPRLLHLRTGRLPAWPRRRRTIRPERSTPRPGRRASRSRARRSHRSRPLSGVLRRSARASASTRCRARSDARGRSSPGPTRATSARARRTRTCTRRCSCTSRRRPWASTRRPWTCRRTCTSPVNFAATDADADPLTYSIAQQGAIGTASIPDPNVADVHVPGSEGGGAGPGADPARRRGAPVHDDGQAEHREHPAHDHVHLADDRRGHARLDHRGELRVRPERRLGDPDRARTRRTASSSRAAARRELRARRRVHRDGPGHALGDRRKRDACPRRSRCT